MRYEPLSNELFKLNRNRFSERLENKSIAVFGSNDVMPTNADGVMPFRQNNAFFYLSGIDQEESFLLLFPDHPDENMREILFIKKTDELIKIWEGPKLTKENATNLSGIKNIYWTTQFEGIYKGLILEVENIYLHNNEHARFDTEVETAEIRLINRVKSEFPLHTIKRAAPILNELRTVKNELEISAIKKAISITKDTFLKVLEVTKAGIYEFDIEAEIHYSFLKNRSKGPAFQTIVASGANACILHYIQNEKKLADGDLILLDFGAEYGNYNADITRCFPVNGKFSDRQKEVYTAVLNVLKHSTSLLTVGRTFKEYIELSSKKMEEELLRMGLLTASDIQKQTPESPAYRKYFMHGMSHFLGLDVHDVGSRHITFQEGMVLTCEPGIYIQDEGIGIRLENDILITNNGPVNLSIDIPVEIEDVERVMGAK